MEMLVLELVREQSRPQPQRCPGRGSRPAAPPRSPGRMGWGSTDHRGGTAWEALGRGGGKQNRPLNTGVTGACSGAPGSVQPNDPHFSRGSEPKHYSLLHFPLHAPSTALPGSANSVAKRQREYANSAAFCVSAGARSWSLFFNPLAG